METQESIEKTIGKTICPVCHGSKIMNVDREIITVIPCPACSPRTVKKGVLSTQNIILAILFALLISIIINNALTSGAANRQLIEIRSQLHDIKEDTSDMAGMVHAVEGGK
jgi:hypothetical protein